MGVEVIGVDRNPGQNAAIPIVAANAVTDPLPEADVAISSLMAHHLTPEENIALIRNVARSCRRFIILDLIRHPVPLVFFTIFICRVIGKEAAVDGRQSIRRAFTPPEFSALVAEALAGTGATAETDIPRFLSRQITDIRWPDNLTDHINDEDRRRFHEGQAWFAQRGGSGIPMNDVLAELGVRPDDFPRTPTSGQ